MERGVSIRTFILVKQVKLVRYAGRAEVQRLKARGREAIMERLEGVLLDPQFAQARRFRSLSSLRPHTLVA